MSFQGFRRELMISTPTCFAKRLEMELLQPVFTTWVRRGLDSSIRPSTREATALPTEHRGDRLLRVATQYPAYLLVAVKLKLYVGNGVQWNWCACWPLPPCLVDGCLWLYLAVC